MTTRRGRTLAWIGTIPHWLYFAALRTNQPLWYRIVVWTSGARCVLVAVLGLVLGVTQFRRRRPFSLASGDSVFGLDALALHHRRRLRRVHADLGVQRLLSMEPFAWTNAPGLRSRATPSPAARLELSQFPAMDPRQVGRTPGGPGDQGGGVRPHPGRAYYVVAPHERARAESKRPSGCISRTT